MCKQYKYRYTVIKIHVYSAHCLRQMIDFLMVLALAVLSASWQTSKLPWEHSKSILIGLDRRIFFYPSNWYVPMHPICRQSKKDTVHKQLDSVIIRKCSRFGPLCKVSSPVCLLSWCVSLEVDALIRQLLFGLGVMPSDHRMTDRSNRRDLWVTEAACETPGCCRCKRNRSEVTVTGVMDWGVAPSSNEIDDWIV
jgi:hypothetical protein